jgi:tetratricopeptide (TPR) repeat protein
MAVMAPPRYLLDHVHDKLFATQRGSFHELALAQRPIVPGQLVAGLVLLYAAISTGCTGTGGEARVDPSATLIASGETLLRSKDYDRAIQHFDLAIRLNPLQAGAYYSRGNAWRAKGRPNRAIADYDKALQLRPQYAAALTARGLAWHDKEEYDRAIADFDAAMQSDPQFAWALNGRGRAWYAKKAFDRALADFDQALRLHPTYAIALNNRGNIWHAKGDYEQAISDYDAAIRLDPSSAGTFHNRGNSWSAKGEYDRAISDYDTAVKLNPSHANAFNGRGDAWRAKGQRDRALDDYDAAIRAAHSRFPDALVNRGLMRFQQGEFAAAGDDFAYAMVLTPTAYRALWLFLSRERSGTYGTAELLANTQASWKAAWPWPILAFYLNEASAEELRAAAAKGGAEEIRKQRCEANFFTGQLLIVRRLSEQAVQFFNVARDECASTSWEHETAVAELKRLPL